MRFAVHPEGAAPRPSGDSGRWLAAVRVAAILAGLASLGLAFASEGFRARLLVGGLGLLVGGALLPRITRVYGTLAILALNTGLLLAGIELASTAVLVASELAPVRALVARITGSPNDLIKHYEGLGYYAEQPWSERYWSELKSALRKRYEAYVVWRSPAFSGETIQIDERGIRRTPGVDCRPGAYRVFVFGGSAIWGWGAPDWATIPAFLQEELQERSARPVCVVNFGEQAYVSSQGVIQLLMQLQRGDVPDLVLFYDGVNEVLAASQTQQPALHQNYDEIARRFQPRDSSPRDSLAALSSLTLLHKVMSFWSPGSERGEPPPDTADLADAVANAYLVNLETVASWAETHGFQYEFFWQPHILLGDKPLSPEEEDIVTGLDWVLPLTDPLRRLFDQTHARIRTEAHRDAHVHDLTGVFDDVESPIWIDTWGHTLPAGNQIAAREMAKILAAPPGNSPAGAGAASRRENPLADPAAPAGASRPNIVFIYTDDQAAWTLDGSDVAAHTPYIDQLAAQGVSFRNAFATTPVCSPSRAGLLTGLAALRSDSAFSHVLWIRGCGSAGGVGEEALDEVREWRFWAPVGSLGRLGTQPSSPLPDSPTHSVQSAFLPLLEVAEVAQLLDVLP